jgi:hypothetical protein
VKIIFKLSNYYNNYDIYNLSNGNIVNINQKYNKENEIKILGNVIEVTFNTTFNAETKLNIGLDNTMEEIKKLYFKEIKKPFLINNKEITFICNATPLNNSTEKIKNAVKDIKNGWL